MQAESALKEALFEKQRGTYNTLIKHPEFDPWVDRMHVLINQLDLSGYVPDWPAAALTISQGAFIWANKLLEKHQAQFSLQADLTDQPQP